MALAEVAVDVVVFVEEAVLMLSRVVALLFLISILSCDSESPDQGLYTDPLNGEQAETQGVPAIDRGDPSGSLQEGSESLEEPDPDPKPDPEPNGETQPDPEPETIPDPDNEPEPEADPLPDPAGTVRRVRVITEMSPSWVAWHEIEIMGTWAGEGGEWINLALGANAVASSSTEEAPPSAAVDGDLFTPWNAGSFPQAYLEIDLGAPANIHEISLKVAQNPPGWTRHSLLFANNSMIFEAVHIFESETQDGDWLVYPPAPEEPPEPALPCSGCLGSAESCDGLCQDNGYEGGLCQFPESTDPATCCECTEPIPPPEVGDELPFDLDEVIWLHKDISGWPITANLSSVSVEGGEICLEYDKKNVWPIYTLQFDPEDEPTDVVANPWVFVQFEGQWYAGTWEWMRPGQTCKAKTSVAGDHIKQQPLKDADWKPSSGDLLYFMVSGLARISGIENVSERSNIVPLIWP